MLPGHLQRLLGIRTNPAVFATSAGLIALFVIFGTLATDLANAIFDAAQSFIVGSLGWFYHFTVAALLVFSLWIGLGRYGKVRLGPDDSRPAFGTLTWFSMLFSAGMGIGVLFWSVAEPLTHYQNPPVGAGGTPEAAARALDITLWHWGLHGWAVYASLGLALAHFSYRRGLPLTIRSALHPLLGARIRGASGHAVDVFAVLGTMFGVATTLGLGSRQINAGLNHLVDLPVSLPSNLGLIAIVTAIATVSVVTGIDRGIRRLSELNIALALLLFAYVLLAGPTGEALAAVATSLGRYAVNLLFNGFWGSIGGDDKWQSSWTLFYWGWWISWAPFVGMFVARISRGRTTRQFVLGVLLVPTLVTCIWFGVFGGSALHRVIEGDTLLAKTVSENFPLAIYVFFEGLPLSTLLSALGTIVIVVFFVTSSDSASLVIDYLTASGEIDPPKRQRIFWATTEGAVASVLLVAGGLKPMRTFQIITGLPLSIILLLTSVSTVMSLRSEGRARRRS